MPGEVEEILVVPRRHLETSGLLGLGFREGSHDPVQSIIVSHGQFLPRPHAEEDPSWKQIIPYAVVRFRKSVFLLRRRRGGGEARLHDLYSIGVGGHINPAPVQLTEAVEDGMRRELREELEWGCGYRARPLGTLNDDSNAVGQVHFGLVFAVDAESDDVRVRETDILEGGFVPIDELGDRLGDMETWSQWVARALFGPALG